jgi:ankyrin repeat protein
MVVTVDEAPARRTRAEHCTLDNGMTPLMAASSLAYPQLEALLVQHGADPALRDWKGRTAADYRAAARTPNPELRTRNPEQRTPNPERRTPNRERRTPNHEPRTRNDEPGTPNRT